MRYVAFNPFYHLDYVRQVLDVPVSTFTRGIVAENPEPCGVVLLDNFTDTSASAHIAVQNPMALRELHLETFKHVFLVLNKRMLLGITPSDNMKALKLHKHLGFTEIARIKDGYAYGVDQVVLQMLREDCKYLTKLREVA